MEFPERDLRSGALRKRVRTVSRRIAEVPAAETFGGLTTIVRGNP